MDICLRRLRGESPEMAELQSVLEAAPRYARLTTDSRVGPDDAYSICTTCPDGKTHKDKIVFGVFLEHTMVGCVDVIRSFPDPQTAHIGLLLIAESYQRRGIGMAAYQLVESEVISWGMCSWMRIGVVQSNGAVIPFWERVGFRPTGETKPYHFGSIFSEVVLMTKPLDKVCALVSKP